MHVEIHPVLDAPRGIFDYPIFRIKELKMNNYPDLTPTNFSQLLRFDVIVNWLLPPEPPRYTAEEILGDPAEEIASYETSAVPVAPIPEIDPDEFESAYQWFLA